ncbi:hypothetical protein ACFE04_000010 [Oxalis oulophora]
MQYMIEVCGIDITLHVNVELDGVRGRAAIEERMAGNAMTSIQNHGVASRHSQLLFYRHLTPPPTRNIRSKSSQSNVSPELCKLQPSDGFLSRNLHQLVTVGDLDRFYLSISELFHDTINKDLSAEQKVERDFLLRLPITTPEGMAEMDDFMESHQSAFLKHVTPLLSRNFGSDQGRISVAYNSLFDPEALYPIYNAWEKWKTCAGYTPQQFKKLCAICIEDWRVEITPDGCEKFAEDDLGKLNEKEF